MSEGLAAFLGATPWASLGVAFAVGLACGWLIWGLRSERASDHAEPGKTATDPDDREEIVVLRAELEAARALLEEGDGQGGDIGRQLSMLDETLKRANGRLKLILRAIRK